MAQAYGGCFLGSSALRAGVVVTDRTRADSRNILHLLKPSSTGTAGGTSLVPVEFQHLPRRGMSELPSTAPDIQASPYSSEQTKTAAFKATAKTTFTARYEGTDVYAPSRSGGKIVAVYAVAKVVMANYYGISGKYKLYHRGAYPVTIGGLKPAHFGSKLKFVVQRYYLGAWRKVASDTFEADGGTVRAQFISRTRGTYRIHTVFAGDAEKLADTSPWAYIKIT